MDFRFLILTAFMALSPRPCAGQQISPPRIEWQKSYGGTNVDFLRGINCMPDGGYFLFGSSASPSNYPGKTAVNYGYSDFWAMRLNGAGDRIWDHSFGGSGDDFLFCVRSLSNGDLLLAGSSYSGASGNKTTPSYVGEDYWIVRVNTNGTKSWDKTFGGSNNDGLVNVHETSDGKLFLIGRSLSLASGNKTSPRFGDYDFWVVFTDTNGNKIWDQTFGGVSGDYVTGSVQASDDTPLITGWSGPAGGGNKTSTNYGSLDDYWVVRVDADGTKTWDLGFGGTGQDSALLIEKSVSGGFVVGGSSTSPTSGNKVSPGYGDYDYWFVRLDINGAYMWDKSYGGTNTDRLQSVVPMANGGFALSGYSRSGPGGNKTSTNFGGTDIWVVRVDADGNLLWDKCLGTDGDELALVTLPMPDGGLVVGGYSDGSQGNKTAPHFGGRDIWLIRLDKNGDILWDQAFGGSGTDQLVDMKCIADGSLILGGRSTSGVSGNKTAPGFGAEDFWIIKLEPERPALEAAVLLPNASGFSFLLNGPSNHYVVEISTNLLDWMPMQTNEVTASGSDVEIVDLTITSNLQRFYRARVFP
jgi:hypothetical protein